MVISPLNQVWVADITYLHTRIDFVYRIAILDIFSQRVMGYTISTRLDTTLTLEVRRIVLAAQAYLRKVKARAVHRDQTEGVGECFRVGNGSYQRIVRELRGDKPVD